MVLNSEIKKAVEESIICWLATADEHGVPNVSPKEIFTYFGDEEILIANIVSPGSVRNIEKNQNVCVSFINVFSQKGFKLKGHAENMIAIDKGYKERFDVLFVMAGERFPIVSVIKIKVHESEPIVAPSYRLYPDTTEKDQIESAMQAYGVKGV